MWIKVEEKSDNSKKIFLPKEINKSNIINKIIKIKFGENETETLVEYIDYKNKEDNKKEITTIYMSKELLNKIMIKKELIYRAKYESGKIVIGPVIALMLGNNTNLYNKRHMKKYEDRFGVYEKVGGLIYAFSPQNVDFDKKIIYGIYFDVNKKEWKYGKLPFPSAIYRRNFHTEQTFIEKMKHVIGDKIYNSYRFNKYELYEHLKNDIELVRHLPLTEKVQNYKTVENFLEETSEIILKPIDLSRGRGICIISKKNDRYICHDYRKKEIQVTEYKNKVELEKFFINNKELLEKYLIQKYIKLANVKGAKFDVRVVMQKDDVKKWDCSGIECRIAQKEVLVTNIARGGYALHLHKTLEMAFGEDCEINDITENIQNICEKIAVSLESMGEHFSEFGMDIAIDEDKNIWLIEVNVFPSFKGFKEMDYDVYLGIRYRPIQYGYSLTEFKNEI